MALLVNWEPGLEDVLYDGGIGREDLSEAEGAVEGEGGGGWYLDKIGDPLYTAVEVGFDLKIRTN